MDGAVIAPAMIRRMTVMVVAADVARVKKLPLPPMTRTARPERAPEGAGVESNGFQ